MKVLIVGNGAREHAICWSISKSPLVQRIYTAPGNAGTNCISENVSIDSNDIDSLMKFAISKNIDLTVVGPEVPLSNGIVDRFEHVGLPIFGPSRAASRIETSKVFAKELMLRHGVPTSRAVTFSDYLSAKNYIDSRDMPLVIKAEGLAAGKGVVVAESKKQAHLGLQDIMKEKKLGSSGDRVLIEDYLIGQEMSVFGFSDGSRISSLFAAQDYKRVGDGNLGPNTGGMGSYSPPVDLLWNKCIQQKVRTSIMEPVIEALKSSGSPYKGVLYAGLMVNGSDVNVIEFNCRFGDPESQVVLPRLKTDLMEVMLAVSSGDISQLSLEWDDRHMVGVVLASNGYPEEYRTGFRICGLDDLDEGVLTFHAGTTVKYDPVCSSTSFLTSGGRVLTVVGSGSTRKDARLITYDNISRIGFEGAFYRNDIADN